MGFLDKLFGLVSSTNESTPDLPGSANEVQPSVSAGRRADFDSLITEFAAKKGYVIQKGVTPESIEESIGRQIYTRGRRYKKPEPIRYVLTKDGNVVLGIRMWASYTTYNRFNNREVRKYFDTNNIKLLDFFLYLPNDVDYVKNRLWASV